MFKKIIPAIFLLLLVGCNQTQPVPLKDLAEKGEFDYGHVKDNKYVNNFFKFEIQLPKGWAIQNQEQIDNITNRGKKLITDNDENMKAIIKASEVNTANLLIAYQHELGSMVETNPNIMIAAENIRNFPGIKSGKEYLFQARKMMDNTQINYSSKEISTETISLGGKEFYQMTAQMEMGDEIITQKFYSTILNDFSFNIIITYFNEAEKENLEKILQTTRFKR